jgi:hypothetical protein
VAHALLKFWADRSCPADGQRIFKNAKLFSLPGK